MSGTPQILLSVISLAILGVTRCPAGISDEAINRLTAAYSAQRIVTLNVGESYTFQPRSGAQRVIKLLALQEHRDSVIHLMSRAEVQIAIDGRPLTLVCEPYTMPTQVGDLRVLADSTAGWGNVPKAVQLSVWEAGGPLVDTNRFGFPLPKYRFCSHPTQCYNEPVYVGEGDGDPAGQRFCHDYGFDVAGYEGRQDVVSVTDGKVALFWPYPPGCSVVVQDTSGFYWSYAHVESLAPGIEVGAHLDKGQKIGLLGKTGPSGNFSHCHLGSYVTPAPETLPGTPYKNGRLNLYPWYVAAYEAAHPKGLLAVARPHRTALTGEKVLLDASHSLVWGGNRIVARRWVLPDGSTVTNSQAQTSFTQPGTYAAALWVRDNEGNEDVDFCQIKVFSRANPEPHMPHLFMSYEPTEGIRPQSPVSVRLWFQGGNHGPISLEFDDGTRIKDCKPYADVPHRFEQSGLHIVTAQCEAAGKPVTAKLKVIVNERNGVGK
jgi:murein DD-endopeptidase MepM/ murein hydrolase activator NlpD